ncbi:MAG: hypothetical protein IT326_01080 [Anaerolineae bacterium]|nr:hypothetical protein [Anaerolineae bacterium]
MTPDTETHRLHPALLWLQRALTAAALLALGFLVLVYLLYFLSLLRFPFDYDQGEGFELWDSVLLARGDAFYRDNTVFPFYSSNYGPTFRVLLTPLVLLFGPHLWIGRTWSFLMTVGIAVLIGGNVWREVKRPALAALAGMAFLASNTVYHIGPLYRSHTTMVFFGLLAVTLMARIDEVRHRQRTILLALVCMMLAIYTKQLAFDAALAVFVFLFLRKPRESILYGLAFVVAFGLIHLLLNATTGGMWSLNAFGANANPFVTGQAETFTWQWLSLHRVIVLLAALYVVYAVYFDRISVYALYFVAGVIPGILSGKWGAGPNYFMAATAAACIGTGVLLGVIANRLGEQAGRNRPARIGLAAWGVIVPLLFIAQAWFNLHLPLDHPLTRPVARALGIPAEAEGRFRQSYYDTVGYTQLGHLITQQDIAAGWYIVEVLRAVPGPVWSEEAMFPINAGKEVVTNPTQLLNLYNQDRLEMDEMIGMIEREEFGAVVFRARFYPLPVLEAIGQHYRVSEQVEMNGFTYDILLPTP